MFLNFKTVHCAGSHSQSDVLGVFSSLEQVRGVRDYVMGRQPLVTSKDVSPVMHKDIEVICTASPTDECDDTTTVVRV